MKLGISLFFISALRTERSPLVSYYGAIAGLQELGPEVIKVFVLPHIKAISARIDNAADSVSVMGGATNMEKIAASHIKNLLVKGCTPVIKTVKQPPDLLDDYKEEFGSIGQYLHANVLRCRGSGSSANVPSSVTSGPPTPATSLPSTNIAPNIKAGPTLVRLSSVSAGNAIPSNTVMGIGTDLMSIPAQAQSLSTVLAPSNTAGNIVSTAALGSNASQRIVVMSPSQAGQVHIVQQSPQTQHPPTSQ